MMIEWARSPESDLRHIFRFIARDSIDAAEKTLLVIVEHSEQLSRFPQSGRLGRKEGTRELVIPATPFFLVYSVEADTVKILRVYHGARSWPH